MRFPRCLVSLLAAAVALSVFAGCSSRSKKERDYPVAVVRFMIEAAPREMAVNVQLPVSQAVIRIQPKSVFTEFDVQGVEVIDGEFGPGLFFQLTPQATRDLFRVTATNQGRRVVTVVNGTPIGAVRIDGPISQGYILTYVEVPNAELADLAKNIMLTSNDAREEVSRR